MDTPTTPLSGKANIGVFTESSPLLSIGNCIIIFEHTFLFLQDKAYMTTFIFPLKLTDTQTD